MDRLILERKLDSLQRCLARIKDKRLPTADALQNDLDTQDVLVLNLTRAVQVSVDIAMHMMSDMNLPVPDTMGQVFEQLTGAGIIDTQTAMAMKKAVGFRNIAVHAYDAINWAIVHAIAHDHLDDFTAFARQIHGHSG